jgi:hypothetical protein
VIVSKVAGALAVNAAAAAAETDVKNIMTNVAPSLNK